MATASKPETENATRLSSTDGISRADSPPDRPRPRRKQLWLVALLILLVVVLWLAPTIVARSPLLNWIVGSIAADLKGKVTVRSASLGWFSFPKLSGVEIRDEQGQPVLEAPEVHGGRSLLAMLWNSSTPGRFRLERPKLHFLVREDGSNVEDVLAAYLAPSDEPWTPLNVGLKIVDGEATISDLRNHETWQIDDLQLTFDMVGDKPGTFQFETSGTVADPTSPARFFAELKTGQTSGGTSRSPSGGPEPTVSDELTVKTERLPLAMLDWLFARFIGNTRLAGRLSSTIRCQWNRPDAADTMLIQGRATVEGLAVTAPALSDDQPHLERLDAVWSVAWQPSRIEVEQLAVGSDVGNASLLGTFDLGAESSPGLLASLPQQTFEVNGRVDLARLAAVLPATLRIREGAQVTSGQLQWALASRRGPEGMNWGGSIEASNLTAVDHGRQLVWQQPIAVTLAVHESPQGPIVEKVQCESDFLKLHAAGSREQLTASANFDLDRLADHLAGLVDLGELRLNGSGWAQFNWQQSDREGFEADGNLEVKNFRLALPDRPGWSEDSLILAGSATGRTDFTADSRIDTARLEIRAGADRLEAWLMQPVLEFRDGGVWPVEIRSEGELARWKPRIEPWITLDPWNVAGSYQLLAETTGSASAIHVRRARLAAEQLRVDGPACHVHEPHAELIVSGSWDGKQRRLESPSTTLGCRSASVQANQVILRLPLQGPAELEAAVTYQGSLDRVQQWIVDTAEPPDWHLQGRFSGKAEVRHAAGVAAARLETTIDDLIATPRSGRQVHEARVRLAASGSYHAKSRSVQLDQAELSSGTIGLQAAGRIALRDDQAGLQLEGQVDYDLEKITELVRPYVGRGVHVAGRGTSPFSYQGPFALDAAQASAGASWQRAEVHGFRVGPGEIRASLSGGMLHFQPLDLEVSEGRLQLAPGLRLAPEPRELYIEPGPVAQQVRINPQMCASALQYIAPVLAGVATAEGRFSIELEGCRIPLSDPTRAELAGRMTVHSVRVGPGPLVRELAVLLGRATPAELTRESVISFQMVDGRVYHRDLELVFPDLTIRTHGSVGLDQSLAILAEMPIPPKWRGSDRTLNAALRNQTIRVPIGGTLSRPKIDRNMLEQLSRQFLENAARNVLGDEVQRGLERLFGPPQ